MIIAIGIDTIDVQRFTHFYQYTHKNLGRIFSDEEISYCLSNPLKSAERFAARFAAKEAFLKAYCQLVPQHSVSLLAIAPLISIKKINQRPHLSIEWDRLSLLYEPQSLLRHTITLSHTKDNAIAVVVLYKTCCDKDTL